MTLKKTIHTLITSSIVMLTCSACEDAASWPAWDGFKQAFLSEDGRVIDRSQDDLRSISEGQAYALFFALVAKDRTSFDRILKWTENNLSNGDLGQHLPAWLWGRDGENWGPLDTNSASDADLWLAYTLHEASRVWCHAPYAEKAKHLGQLIVQQEVKDIEGLGTTVLPGPQGFVKGDSVKLNPSYLPPFLMARLADIWPEEPIWTKIYLGSQHLMLNAARTGFYPDWVLYTQGKYALPENDQRGDYDAIRAYLWVGMTPPSTPGQASLRAALTPLISIVEQRKEMPEWTEPTSNQVSDKAGPLGFQAAMAPLLDQMGKTKLAKTLHEKGMKQGDAQAWRDYGYYNAALTLFAQGYMDKRYRFGTNGQLLPSGKEVKRCG